MSDTPADGDHLVIPFALAGRTAPCQGCPDHAEHLRLRRETARRVAKAKRICLACPHTERCRELAGPVDDRGVSRWTGIWAGEVRLNADDMRRTRRDAKRRAAS